MKQFVLVFVSLLVINIDLQSVESMPNHVPAIIMSESTKDMVMRVIAPFTSFLTKYQKELIVATVFSFMVATIAYYTYYRTWGRRPLRQELLKQEPLKREARILR